MSKREEETADAEEGIKCRKVREGNGNEKEELERSKSSGRESV